MGQFVSLAGVLAVYLHDDDIKKRKLALQTAIEELRPIYRTITEVSSRLLLLCGRSNDLENRFLESLVKITGLVSESMIKLQGGGADTTLPNLSELLEEFITRSQIVVARWNE